RPIVEPESRVSRLELLRILEEADDLAALGVRGHAVPKLRCELRRARLYDRVDSLGDRPVTVGHLRDLREHGTLVVRLAGLSAAALCRPHLLSPLLHSGPFLFGESLRSRVGFGGTHGGLPRI